MLAKPISFNQHDIGLLYNHFFSQHIFKYIYFIKAMIVEYFFVY